VQRVDANKTSTSIYLVMVNPPPEAIGIVPQHGARKLAQQTRMVGKHTDAPPPNQPTNRRAASKGPGGLGGCSGRAPRRRRSAAGGPLRRANRPRHSSTQLLIQRICVRKKKIDDAEHHATLLGSIMIKKRDNVASQTSRLLYAGAKIVPPSRQHTVEDSPWMNISRF